MLIKEDRKRIEHEEDQKIFAYNVEKARKEEVGYMLKGRVWVERPVEECWQKTGKAPVSVRWVDTDKGVDGWVDVRSRLVARDFKGKGGGKEKEDSLYASTPPLEALRMLCSKAAAPGRNARRRKMLFMDARKAHLNPKCAEEVYKKWQRRREQRKGCAVNWNSACMG